ncbi:MAG: PEP/pyruvate-binding domain-containing protein, partial [Acidimicrobiales bacterium]
MSETFPRPLRPLEVDMWAYPLRAGIADALRTLGTASEHRLAASPVLAVIGGWVAVDLDLLGMAPTNHRILRALDPRGPAHRLGAAWRVGKLRASLPELAGEAVRRVEDHLRAVPPLRELSDTQLAGLLRNATTELVALHSHEVVAGMLVRPTDEDEGSTTAASLALAVLASGRREGRTDAEIVARDPVALALTPPRLGPPAPLPPTTAGVQAGGNVQDLVPREALRLRARWVQELTGRAGHELGVRLAAAGRLPDPEALAHLGLDEVAAVVAGGAVPQDFADRAGRRASPPLPATFRLTKRGEVVPVVDRHAQHGGRAAGGGRGVGRVRHWDSG